jgi:acetoacetyl-[acyl-carrier protein] synthase
VCDTRALDAGAAGQLPTGFDPQALYAARSHPRGLQMTVYAASDALGNLGLSWDTVASKVAADHISVYAGSAMSQLDAHGNGGLIASRHQGRRVTSKHVAMGLAEMPADFVNAYVLGNVGSTGHNMGACATFLYNLRQGVHDIREGRARIALIGGAEAPLVPEVMDGLTTMGALGTDQALLQLDKDQGRSVPDYRRACRPFAENCGFTVAEGAQFVVLMDDELALELGADIHAVIADVYVNADGHKKSITSPGVGNYITFAKAVKLAEQILGTQAVRHRSFVQAHGTGTPQNRVTESRILNETAKVFGIQDWPVAAIKCYLGHTMAVASGDQLVNALGVWPYGIIPGIATIDRIAADVHASQLRLSPQHLERGVGELDIAFLNAKGFGGNNATATVLAPHIAAQVLEHKHGAKRMNQWREQAEQVREQALAYDRASTAGKTRPIYRFDDEVRGDEHGHLTPSELRIDGYTHPIALEVEPPFTVPW